MHGKYLHLGRHAKGSYQPLMTHIMRKYILLSLFALLAFVSCDRKVLERDTPDNMVKVRFNVALPVSSSPGTKAFSHEIDVNNLSLKVVVFDQNGVYMTQSTASFNKSQTPENATININYNNGGSASQQVKKYAFEAYLPGSDNHDHRIIHFIANYDGAVAYGTELEVISQLSVSGNVDAYWQRVDEVDLYAEDKGEGLMFQTETYTKLSTVALIRNFCEIKVEAADGSGVEIVGAALFNVPTSGNVAPYSSDKSEFVGATGKFISGYQEYQYPQNLIAAGYDGAVPWGYSLSTPLYDGDNNVSVTSAGADGKVILFSYERETPVDNPPYVLVKAKYNGSSTATWYKINLRDLQDNYFPLLRNFSYQIKISRVTGAGKATAKQAAESTGSGDISTDLGYLDLPEMSNGEASMSVSESQVVLVTDELREVKFKFLPDADVDTSNNNMAMDNNNTVSKEYPITITLEKPDQTGAVFNLTPGLITNSGNGIISYDSTVKDAEGWRTLTFRPMSPGQVEKTQAVTITGKYDYEKNSQHYTGTVSRTISFLLVGKYTMTLNSPTVAATQGTGFDLIVTLPENLPHAIFPLTLDIESDKNTISANGLPVKYVTSKWNSSKPAIVFEKIVQLGDYTQNGGNVVTIPMKSNIAESACKIRVDNPYFNEISTDLTN